MVVVRNDDGGGCWVVSASGGEGEMYSGAEVGV